MIETIKNTSIATKNYAVTYYQTLEEILWPLEQQKQNIKKFENVKILHHFGLKNKTDLLTLN